MISYTDKSLYLSVKFSRGPRHTFQTNNSLCESYALIRESYAFIRESYAFIREKYNFFPYENELIAISQYDFLSFAKVTLSFAKSLINIWNKEKNFQDLRSQLLCTKMLNWCKNLTIYHNVHGLILSYFLCILKISI